MATAAIEGFQWSTATSSSISVSAPSGIEEGELLLIHATATWVGSHEWTSGSAPAGWNFLGDSTISGADVGVYWKIAEAGDIGSSVTLSGVNSYQKLACYLRISSPEFPSPMGTPSWATGTGTSITNTGITTSEDNVLVLGFWGFDGADGNNSNTPGGTGGFSLVTNERVSSGSPGNAAQVLSLVKATAGATGSLIITAPVSDGHVLGVVEVRSASATFPTIDTQPTNQAASDGATATFTVSATSSGGALTYQWYDASDDSVISGETGSSYTTGVLAYPGDNGLQFYVIVTDDNGSTQSDTATLTVTPPPLGISDQPEDVTVDLGEDAVFTVAASGGSGVYSYQWYDASDDSALPGETGPTLTITTTIQDDGSEYYCIVDDGA